MMVRMSEEVGSLVNQASQRAVRNGWFATLVYIASVLSWGGIYHPAWDDGGMVRGATFAGLALFTPMVMLIVAVISYRRHLRRLQQALLAGDPVKKPGGERGRALAACLNPAGCELCA